MSFIEYKDFEERKILQSTLDNPKSKLYAHSSMFMAINALKMWTLRYKDATKHRLMAYSRTTYNTCKKNDAWELFEQLKAAIVDISLDKGRGKNAIRIHVETPQVLVNWLRQPETLARLEDVQSNNSRVGQLVIKLYDYNLMNQIEAPRQVITMTDYLMAILIMQNLSPIVSIYKDMCVQLRMSDGKFETLPLRQFIPEEIQWGVAKFVPHYMQVILDMFVNRPLKFEVRKEEVGNGANVRHIHDFDGSDVIYYDNGRYFRIVSGIHILKTDFSSYPFDSIVRDEMTRQLDLRLQHCKKKTGVTVTTTTVSTTMVEKNLDVLDASFLPDIQTFNVSTTPSSTQMIAAADVSETSFTTPDIASIVNASLQATLARKGVKKRKAPCRDETVCRSEMSCRDQTNETETCAVIDRMYNLISDL